MPTQPYHLNGKRVPSVTTILGVVGYGSDGLMRWANQRGLEGTPIDAATEIATQIGTTVHAWIQGLIARHEMPMLDVFDENGPTGVAWRAWLAWASQRTIEPLACEVPMVSVHGVGGTPDLVGVEAERVTVYDWKTGRAPKLRAKHVIQAIAYASIWDELQPARMVDDVCVVTIGHETGELVEHRLPVTDARCVAAAQAWNAARVLYAAQKEIEG